MRRGAVQSSSLRSVGYDRASKTLEVEFVEGGRIYRYAGVPGSEYRRLMDAESHGRYFTTYIRGHYPYIKVA